MFNLGGLMAVIVIFVMIAPMVLAFAKSWWTPRILCVLISGVALWAGLPVLGRVTSYSFALWGAGTPEDQVPASTLFGVFALPIFLWLGAMICGLACYLDTRRKASEKTTSNI